jgi:hypothetical protein
VAAGTVHGFSVAFIFAAGFLALALVAVTVLVTSKAASGTSPVPLGEGVSDAGEAGEAGDVGVVLLPT